MDEGYYISCCSSSDLSTAYFSGRRVKYVCFHFELDDVDYLDDMGESIAPEELFDRMLKGASTKTSQVSVGEYEEFFEQMLREGKDILHITLSSGISGTLNSALLAAENLREKYPERKIYVEDSLAASSGYGLLVDSLCDLRDQGMDIDSLRSWLLNNRLRVQHWFFSTDLTFFIRGGRISKAAGVVGTVLGICPLMNVDSKGRLAVIEKVRGKTRVMKRVIEKIRANTEDGNLRGRCFISHSMCEEDAVTMADMIKNSFPTLKDEIFIYPIGATIGCHTGPGTIAIFFLGKPRDN